MKKVVGNEIYLVSSALITVPTIGSLLFLRSSGYQWHLDRWLDAAFICLLDTVLLQVILVAIGILNEYPKRGGSGRNPGVILMFATSVAALLSAIFFVLSLRPYERVVNGSLCEPYMATATVSR
ncbi:unnamed protein product [Enterobius vermicularis]|uniref:Uncharacterized protein n=1 Tax=Enterobius vermicularis TaxID=51028 RepID=A0A0N4VCM9_ENTVE|nr:unnamed protein product [Enterobius vermicularis]